MEARTTRLPYGISSYIQDRFRDGFLFEMKSVKNERGHLLYGIEVTKDDHIYLLQFNDAGKLLKEEVAEAFPPDGHDELTLEDTPE
jgi:hypothetical protein